MKDKRFELFTSAIAQISKSIQKIKTREMANFGLRGAHVMCLFYLRQSNAGLTAAELSGLCETDKGAVSRTVSELESQGYVSFPEPETKRKYKAVITLTEAGAGITEKLGKIIDDAVQKASFGLSKAEREVFYKALLIISRNLQTLASC